ncbi:hypothetical protein BDW42DRAFT_177513 [Aspergillus taichungensis]|uniref:Uncharacterized protein n=1 Tax=Aspergillus taichungensis TaxID=482145 RepID=A0A2J5HJE7_9EURO|nr:hypothetical protein BDW42DRAFT_177513 [Aspergillus taichungensis]
MRRRRRRCCCSGARVRLPPLVTAPRVWRRCLGCYYRCCWWGCRRGGCRCRGCSSGGISSRSSLMKTPRLTLERRRRRTVVRRWGLRVVVVVVVLRVWRGVLPIGICRFGGLRRTIADTYRHTEPSIHRGRTGAEGPAAGQMASTSRWIDISRWRM